MTTFDTYNKFCGNWISHNSSENEITDFLNDLAKLFNVKYATAQDLWYAPQRSWFVPEMMDAIISLDKDETAFHPCFATGEFDWDEKRKKFIPLLKKTNRRFDEIVVGTKFRMPWTMEVWPALGNSVLEKITESFGQSNAKYIHTTIPHASYASLLPSAMIEIVEEIP